MDCGTYHRKDSSARLTVDVIGVIVVIVDPETSPVVSEHVDWKRSR